jgi:sulfatase maturation enzyme AslB (radical SAM superfamily)
MQEIAAASCNEGLAGCSDCAFLPYCGADPVYHYATQGDMFGHRPTSGFCHKNKSIIRHLIELWRDADDQLRDIFWSWIRSASIEEVRPQVPQWLSR